MHRPELAFGMIDRMSTAQSVDQRLHDAICGQTIPEYDVVDDYEDRTANAAFLEDSLNEAMRLNRQAALPPRLRGEIEIDDDGRLHRYNPESDDDIRNKISGQVDNLTPLLIKSHVFAPDQLNFRRPELSVDEFNDVNAAWAVVWQLRRTAEHLSVQNTDEPPIPETTWLNELQDNLGHYRRAQRANSVLF